MPDLAQLTAQQLYDQIDERRRRLRLPWWRVAVVLDTCDNQFARMRRGQLSDRLRIRALMWLASTDTAS